MVAILRVVGPPGSGKTLLIVSLAEALRSRGHRVATVVERRSGGNEAATVIVLSNGGRVTIEQPLTLDRLRALVPTLDPSAAILLAEGYDDDAADAAFPAIALAPRGSARSASQSAGALAVVATEDIEATFARAGPGETNGLVDLVEREVLGLTPRAARRGWRGLLTRLRAGRRP